MNVHLTPELEQFVHDKVQTGRYNSASEVIREALRLMEERDQIKAEVRKKIAAGVESARAGRLVDGEAFFAQMEAELDEEIRAKDEKESLARATAIASEPALRKIWDTPEEDEAWQHL